MVLSTEDSTGGMMLSTEDSHGRIMLSTEAKTSDDAIGREYW